MSAPTFSLGTLTTGATALASVVKAIADAITTWATTTKLDPSNLNKPNAIMGLTFHRDDAAVSTRLLYWQVPASVSVWIPVEFQVSFDVLGAVGATTVLSVQAYTSGAWVEVLAGPTLTASVADTLYTSTAFAAAYQAGIASGTPVRVTIQTTGGGANINNSVVLWGKVQHQA